MRFLTALIVPAALLLGACGAPASAPTATYAADGAAVIEVRDAFIVQPPEGRDITGGGLHVSVQGAPVTLVRATTAAARETELHTMSMENDMMQMRKVDSFPVSEDAPLVLERGGNHLMFFGVGTLELGEQVDVILTFTDESGTEQEIVTQAEVVSPAG
ncbi:MAG: copper chaperone PCu(A)C [Hyphomonas sp.]